MRIFTNHRTGGHCCAVNPLELRRTLNSLAAAFPKSCHEACLDATPGTVLKIECIGDATDMRAKEALSMGVSTTPSASGRLSGQGWADA